MSLSRLLSQPSGVIPLTLEREGWQGRASLAYTFRSASGAEEGLRALLSPGEQEVASRYHLPRRLHSFLLGRACAKEALAPLLNEPDPTRISIDSGVFGQPLVRHTSESSYEVSLTHWEGGAAALAYPEGHPMGIDGEAPDPQRLETMAAALTSEEAHWASVSPLLRTTAAWTAREALSKAVRCGLTIPLEFLAIAPPAETVEASENGIALESRYAHFAQYRFLTLAHPQAIVSICLPRHTRLIHPASATPPLGQVEY